MAFFLKVYFVNLMMFCFYSYKENMKKLSTILRDTPSSPLDKAIWWTEYVLRHHGADHLKPSSLDLYWFQFILLDVIVTIFIVIVIIVLLIMLVIRKTFTIFRRKVKTEWKEKYFSSIKLLIEKKIYVLFWKECLNRSLSNM